MSLKDQFNGPYTSKKENHTVLCVHYDTLYNYYDFTARMLTTCNGSNSVAVVPFSQLDHDTLIAMRDRLIDLGGTPPELPAETPATQPAARKLNL